MDKNFGGCSDGNGKSQHFFGQEQWAYGYTAALGQINMAGFDQTSHGYENDPNSHVEVENNHGIQDAPSMKSQRGTKKKVSRRGSAFTKEEDKVICSAFLNVSKDPITGVNQTLGGYYKRLHDYFNEHKPEGCVRSQIAVQHRWTLIQKAMNKFCCHKVAVDRLNQSGKNEQDRIDDAVLMYEKTEPFTFMHCWKMLRNEPKWNDRFLELNSTPSRAEMPTGAAKGHTTSKLTESENENGDTSRPEGRDSAKRRRSAGDTASSSAAVDVLQRLNEKSEKNEKKQDQQMAEILNRKDEKIKIQKDLFNLQKKQMRISIKQHKKESEIREKQTEAQLISAEASIMSIDVEKVPPYLKSYYLGMQQQIMERRGFSSAGNNED